jgi:hypothetical protein
VIMNACGCWKLSPVNINVNVNVNVNVR